MRAVREVDPDAHAWREAIRAARRRARAVASSAAPRSAGRRSQGTTAPRSKRAGCPSASARRGVEALARRRRQARRRRPADASRRARPPTAKRAERAIAGRAGEDRRGLGKDRGRAAVTTIASAPRSATSAVERRARALGAGEPWRPAARRGGSRPVAEQSPRRSQPASDSSAPPSAAEQRPPSGERSRGARRHAASRTSAPRSAPVPSARVRRRLPDGPDRRVRDQRRRRPRPVGRLHPHAARERVHPDPERGDDAVRRLQRLRGRVQPRSR